MRVGFVVPDLFGLPGGIARHCCLVAKALGETPAVTHLDVFALNDRAGGRPDARYLSGAGRTYQAFGGNRASFLRGVLSHLARHRYDVVISGHVNLTPLLFAPPRFSNGPRRITVIYGIDAWRRLPPYRRLPLVWSDRALAISAYTARVAARANAVPLAKVAVLPCCLDPYLAARVSMDSPSTLPPFGPHALLTVSRLLRRESSKGHHQVLRAIPSVLERVPDLEYYVVGEGDLRPDLQTLADALGIASHVHFLGRVTDQDLSRAYEQCSVFVMPAKEEGFGLVFLEAMAHSRPVIAGNKDASPEVVGDGEAGLLVDPDDVGEIAAAIATLLTDEARCRYLGAAGRARLERLFLFDHFRARLLDQLAAVVGE